MNHHEQYRFGAFTLDPVAKVLFRDGQPVHVPRKAVETLLVLAGNAGQVVTKEEIMQAVWPDRVVEEANLAQNIAVIRKALGAQPGSPAHIETFPGRGYRLEGPVARTVSSEVEQTAAAPSAAAPRPGRGRGRLMAGIALMGLAAAAALVWRAIPRDADWDNLKFAPWTRMPGKEFQPAISPDGRWVAFLWMQQGSEAPGVFVQGEGQNPPRKISAGGVTHSSPCWSPDGAQVAYLRVGRDFTEVLAAPRNGGAARLIARLSPPNYGIERRLMDWSPDGRTLVVAHADSPGRPLALTLIDIASGARRPLTQPAGDERGDVDPRFSPDGRTVSFIREFHRNRQELYSVAAAGGPARVLTAQRGQITSQDWAEEGRALLYASDQDGEYRIWRLAGRGGGSPKPVAVYGEFPIQLSVARHARVLAYTSLQQDRNIWQLELASRTWKRLIASTAQDASPQYSPDGRLILFRSDRGGSEQLWVSDAETGEAEQVTRGGERPSVGRWSPDGRRVVFNDPVTRAIGVAERGEHGWVTRSLKQQGVHPVFSSDGKWIYAGGLTEIVRIPAEGGDAQSIVKSKAESLNVSRDGQWIYFVREPNDTTLWRVSASSGEMEKVLEGLLPSCSSCYALAEDAVYYLGSGPDTYDRQLLYRFDPRARRSVVVTEYPEPLWPIGSGPFSLSPDGKRLLTVRVDPSNSDLMRVTWGGNR